MWTLVGLVACLAAARAAVIKGGTQVPTYTEPCFRNSPEFDTCVKRALQAIIPKLARAGIPELELETVDPLRVVQVVMTYDTNSIGGNVTLQDTVTRGIGKLKIMEVRSVANDPNQFLMEIDFFIPKMVTGGLYNMQGHIGDIPISGEDTYNITMADLTAPGDYVSFSARSRRPEPATPTHSYEPTQPRSPPSNQPYPAHPTSPIHVESSDSESEESSWPISEHMLHEMYNASSSTDSTDELPELHSLDYYLHAGKN